MNTRVSTCRDPDVLAAIEVLRTADVTHAHLEIPLHDFDDDGIFGAAEGALAWYRGPTAIADELRWLGVDLVSTASNHSLDYSYGGLRSTCAALDAAGLAHAGKALTSPPPARPPSPTPPRPGRPGLRDLVLPRLRPRGRGQNRRGGPPRRQPAALPARHRRGDRRPADLDRRRPRPWVVRDDDAGEFVIHPPGLHNSIWRFRLAAGDADGDVRPTTRCDESDLAGNLDSIRYARSVSDLVIAHLHVQAWDGADGRMSSSPAFAHEFGHAAAAAGASVVLIQGAHAPMRGIEVHAGIPILYDPGPLFRLGRREPQPPRLLHPLGQRPPGELVRRHPPRRLRRPRHRPRRPRRRAWRPAAPAKTTISPREGYSHEPGFFVPVCDVDPDTHRVRRVNLYPMTWSRTSRATTGFPVRVTGPAAQAILDQVAELSAPYGTDVSSADDVGWVAIP